MARPVILSNGRMMVGLDESGLVHDFYYPYVGENNVTNARQLHHKIGLWVDGQFSWLDSNSWLTVVDYESSGLVSRVSYLSEKLGIKIESSDFVDSACDVFGRRMRITNLAGQEREARLFMHQVFRISHAGRRDTAMFVPAKHHYILAYSGNISFVCGMRTADGRMFDQYAVGNYQIEGKAGTFVDAEDGQLSGNSIEHGGVDSVIGLTLKLPGHASDEVDYWVAASDKNYHESSGCHRFMALGGLEEPLARTRDYWREWLRR